jgi:seryl-tRNA synthetase
MATRSSPRSISKRTPAYKKFTKLINEYNALVRKHNALAKQIGAAAQKNTPAGRAAQKRLTTSYNAIAKKGKEVIAARTAVLKTR